MNEACEDLLGLLRDLENQLSGSSLGGLSFILLFASCFLKRITWDFVQRSHIVSG